MTAITAFHPTTIRFKGGSREKQVGALSAPPDATRFSIERPQVEENQTRVSAERILSARLGKALRFGNETQTPALSTAQHVQNIKAGIQGLPGAEALENLINEWTDGIPWEEPNWNQLERTETPERVAELRTRWTTNPWRLPRGAKDEALINYVGDRMWNMIHCNEMPIGTLRKALDSGLQALFDDVLKRNVLAESQFKNGILWTSSPTYNPNHFEIYHVGQYGSEKLVPFLETFLKTDKLEQVEHVINALEHMSNRVTPDRQAPIRQALEKLADQKIAVQLKVLEKYPLATTPLLILSQSGQGPEVVRAFTKAWDATLNFKATLDERDRNNMDEKSIAREKKEAREYILSGWLELVERGLPGAIDALAPRREEIEEFLTTEMAQENRFDIRMIQSEQGDVIKAGLLANSLADLPSRTPPEGYKDFNGRMPWRYSADNASYFIPFIRMTQAMANRGIDGAQEMNKQLRAQLDDFYINQLKDLTDGIPKDQPSYFYSDSSLKFILSMGQYGRKKVIPALKRLLDEPWHPSITWGNTSNGNPQYTSDPSVIAKNKAIRTIESVIDSIQRRAEKAESPAN